MIKIESITNFLTHKPTSEIKEFLVQNEPLCISVSNQFLDNGVFFIPSPMTDRISIILENEKIIGIIDSTIRGSVYHYLKKIPHDFSENEFSQIINYRWLYSITGEKRGSDFLIEQIKKHFSVSPVHTVNYFFEQCTECKTKFPFSNNYLKSKLIIEQAKNTEYYISILLPLRIGYEIEEVLFPGSNINSEQTKKNLSNLISKQKMFFLAQVSQKENSFIENLHNKNSFAKNSIIESSNNDTNIEAIATVTTNAHGFNWEQIGGVFTTPKFRNQGIAKTLVNHITTYLINKNKKVCLFVKTQNTPAQKAYEKNGFKKIDNFTIAYFSHNTDKKVNIGK